jgi:hypothetical protein
MSGGAGISAAPIIVQPQTKEVVDKLIMLMRINRVSSTCVEDEQKSKFAGCNIGGLMGNVTGWRGHKYTIFFENLYHTDYEQFCRLEDFITGRGEISRKLDELTTLVRDLSEKLTYMPFGAEYESAKHEFETLAKK